MTSQGLLDRLLAWFPDFGPVWDGEHNYFRHDDGFTCCGVFSQFTHFFRDRYAELTPAQIVQFGAFVTECAASADDDLPDAVLACFLENLEGEPLMRDFRRYLTSDVFNDFFADR